MNSQAWNQLATRFETRVCDITSTSGRRLAAVLRTVKLPHAATLVDAGCGIGSFSRRFGKKFQRVIAFDFSPRMVARAKRRCADFEHATWQTMDLGRAGAALGPIGDLTVCLNVITSPDGARRRQQWSSLANLARPGGYVLVVLPSLESARYVAKFEGQRAVAGAKKSAEGLVYRGRAAQKHYSRQELRDTVAHYGLRVRTLARVHYPWDNEGLDDSAPMQPWDWVCLARKPKLRSQPRRQNVRA